MSSEGSIWPGAIHYIGCLITLRNICFPVSTFLASLSACSVARAMHAVNSLIVSLVVFSSFFARRRSMGNVLTVPSKRMTSLRWKAVTATLRGNNYDGCSGRSALLISRMSLFFLLFLNIKSSGILSLSSVPLSGWPSSVQTRNHRRRFASTELLHYVSNWRLERIFVLVY